MSENQETRIIGDAFNFACEWSRGEIEADVSNDSSKQSVKYGLIIYSVQKAMREREISPLLDKELFDRCVEGAWKEVGDCEFTNQIEAGGRPPKSLLDESWAAASSESAN